MRSALAEISESLKVWSKANAAQKISDASVFAERAASEALSLGRRLSVCRVDIGSDGKAAKKLQDNMTKIHPEGSFIIISFDEENDRVALYAVVSPAHVAAGVSGVEWCNACTTAAGAGKGGGKPALANASIPCDSMDTLEVIVGAANAFASSK